MLWCRSEGEEKYSPSRASAIIIRDIALLHARRKCLSWFAWVPTGSNIGDEASRYKFGEAVRIVPHLVRDKVRV